MLCFIKNFYIHYKYPQRVNQLSLYLFGIFDQKSLSFLLYFKVRSTRTLSELILKRTMILDPIK